MKKESNIKMEDMLDLLEHTKRMRPQSGLKPRIMKSAHKNIEETASSWRVISIAAGIFVLIGASFYSSIQQQRNSQDAKVVFFNQDNIYE